MWVQPNWSRRKVFQKVRIAKSCAMGAGWDIIWRDIWCKRRHFWTICYCNMADTTRRCDFNALNGGDSNVPSTFFAQHRILQMKLNSNLIWLVRIDRIQALSNWTVLTALALDVSYNFAHEKCTLYDNKQSRSSGHKPLTHESQGHIFWGTL